MTLPVRPAFRGGQRRRLAGHAAGTALGAASLAVVWAVDPNEPGHFPPCPFRALTGWWCPACGGLRATHALLHGDVSEAMARHPAILAVAALAVTLWLVRLRAAVGGQVPVRPPRPWMTGAAVSLTIVFTVLRNLPGWTWLSPA